MYLPAFREIVFVDFEFEVSPGERPVPVCLVAKELRSDRIYRLFQNEFGAAPIVAVRSEDEAEIRTGSSAPGRSKGDSCE